MITFKLVSAADQALFEERLSRIVRALGEHDVVDDVRFDTTTAGDGTVTYSALLQLRRTKPRS